MFETHERAIMPSESLPEEPLFELSFVSQRLHSEWFYVTQAYVGPDCVEMRKGEMLIDSMDNLKSFLATKFKNSYVFRVVLVVPPAMNGTEDWSMAPLLEINEFSLGSKREGHGYIYKIGGGSQLYSTSPDGGWELGLNKLIYKHSVMGGGGEK